MAEFGGEIISIRAGKSSFHIHESLVKESSTLRHSLRKQKEARGYVYTLIIPDKYTEALQCYINWIYRRIIPCADSEQQTRKESINLVKAYIIGKKLGDTEFQNAVIDEVIERASGKCNGSIILPDAETVRFTYEEAKGRSGFKALLVDLYASNTINGYFCKPASSKYPKLFLIDVLSAVADMRRTGRPSPTEGGSNNICKRFHKHTQGTKC
ncbi:hypothetical protein H105_01862 [Trichophyton soudanense CBS 452.61]|uniref:BTB domain-containing protein n=1 Tax=Trichophyton soudanense CBS 452.61 TaxID=1215331 RepID=A0A022Y1J4_TRISD|nr:hypothetical protein H105_01862 [Trichophyton soudanense CBS 452.61]